MTATLEDLVRETVELTGAQLPTLLDRDAPVLDRAAISDSAASFYLVGLIGGKEVGKSALVNALAGQPVTQSTAFGPGTEAAIAYAHVSQAPAVSSLLEQAAPGRFRVVTHRLATLRAMVLVDLPDIDSHFKSHLQTTRAVLRHLLFPVWVGSVEKYADQQPQQMLAQVAAGNAPANFVFCLNKADQLEEGGGKEGTGSEEGTEARRHQGTKGGGEEGAAGDEAGGDESPNSASSTLHFVPSCLRASVPSSSPPSSPVDEIRCDYAERIARTLELPSPPRVFVISATHPERFDLPELRALLMQQKPETDVSDSRSLARGRQEQTLLQWLGQQELPVRARRLEQLREEAEGALGARLGPALLERVVPRLENDAAAQQAVADEVLEARVARWPMVNLVHTMLAPLFLLVRGMTSKNAGPPRSAQGVIDASFRETDEPVSALVQSAFGQLRRSQPLVGELYAQRRLWESEASDAAAAELSRLLAQTLLCQRLAARQQLGGRHARLGAPARWLLTVGALLWFPFIQPMLALALSTQNDLSVMTLLGLFITVLGVDYLLKSAGFLLIWFLVLWLALRWNSQRRVARLMGTWQNVESPDPSVNLTRAAMDWMDGLLTPLKEAEARLRSLADRVEAIEPSLKRAS